MQIERREEFLIDKETSTKIKLLLQACFPDYPTDRTYFKQVPHSRILVWEKLNLIGHASLEYRKIKVGNKVFRVFLIGDICVQSTYQHQKIGTKIIDKIQDLAEQNTIEFLVVTVTNDALYKKNGFRPVDNICKWVIIQQHSTIGIRQRSLNSSLMIKQIGSESWPEGIIDFLGYIV